MDGSFKNIDYSIEGSASAKAYIKPSFNLWLYDAFCTGIWFKPYVSGEITAGVKNSPDADLCWSLKAGLDAGLHAALGVTVGPFDLDLLDWSPEIPGIEVTLTQDCVSNTTDFAKAVKDDLAINSCPSALHEDGSVESGGECCEDSDCKQPQDSQLQYVCQNGKCTDAIPFSGGLPH